jgi:hypothetical protein
MLLNSFHLPNGYEYRVSSGDQMNFGQIFAGDLHPDYDYAARYTAMEPALGKQARAQQLVQLAPLLQQNPWIEQRQWLKTILELGDIREAEYLLKSPQQFMQEMQQQQQAAMMAEVARQQYETKGKLTISEKDFQEDLVLNEQTFGHDMALKAIEGEMSNEKSAA